MPRRRITHNPWRAVFVEAIAPHNKLFLHAVEGENAIAGEGILCEVIRRDVHVDGVARDAQGKVAIGKETRLSDLRMTTMSRGCEKTISYQNSVTIDCAEIVQIGQMDGEARAAVVL